MSIFSCNDVQIVNCNSPETSHPFSFIHYHLLLLRSHVTAFQPTPRTQGIQGTNINPDLEPRNLLPFSQQPSKPSSTPLPLPFVVLARDRSSSNHANSV